MSPKPWYHKGLRFDCQRCGRCCTQRGEHTFVYLTGADLTRLADSMGLAEAAFVGRFCEHVEGRLTLRTDTRRCIFQDESGACSVYDARPHQCRSWPFWRENLERAAWERDVVPLCPGAGQGTLHSAEEIEAIARDDEEWYAQP